MRKTARLASSRISPTRPIGMRLPVSSRPADCGDRRSQAPLVGNGPGAIAFRRMPCGPHSLARDLVMMLMPALDIAEGTVNGPPFQIQVARTETTLARESASIQRLPQARVT